MTSWILTTRNDGYGGDLSGCGNYAMRRLIVTVNSIRWVAPADEIIVVEWCPDGVHEPLERFLIGTGARVITVCRAIQDRLDRDNPSERKLSFYEVLAKHAAVGQTSSDKLIFCNPDNVFTPRGFTGELIRPGMIIRAVRQDVAADYAIRPMAELFHWATCDGFRIVRTCAAAAGDFTGIHRSDYELLGGYTLKHINWHADNDLLERARANKIIIERTYKHYHLAHEKLGANERSQDWAAAAPIDQRIVDDIAGYIIADKVIE